MTTSWSWWDTFYLGKRPNPLALDYNSHYPNLSYLLPVVNLRIASLLVVAAFDCSFRDFE